jgi:hypothetical protein
VVRATLMTSPDSISRLLSLHAFSELDDGFRDQDRIKVRDGQPAQIRVEAFAGIGFAFIA